MSAKTVIYYDIYTDNMYDGAGNYMGNKNMSFYLGNSSQLELHYITGNQSGTSTDDPATWDKWTELEGLPVASQMSVDNNYQHAYKGTLTEDVAISSATISVTLPFEVDSYNFNYADNIVLYKEDGTSVTLPYSSFEMSGAVMVFTLTDATNEAYSAGLSVRIPQALLLSVPAEDIDNTNCGEGIFVFDFYVMSRRLIEMLDYTNIASISANMEHQIIVDGNVSKTFAFQLNIMNLLNFNELTTVPPTGDWASKAYVQSVIEAAFKSPIVFQYSADGETDWHDTQQSTDLYMRFTLSYEFATWSAPMLIPRSGVIIDTKTFDFTTTTTSEQTLTWTKEELGIVADAEPQVTLWLVNVDGTKTGVSDSSYIKTWGTDSLSIRYYTTWSDATWQIKMS